MEADIVERYLVLGLRLGRHIDGLVDAYYGPAHLALRVASEPIASTATLVQDALGLRDEVTGLGGSPRSRWLLAQAEGLLATAQRLDGLPIGYLEEIRRCYGLTPERADEDELADPHAPFATPQPEDRCGDSLSSIRLARSAHAEQGGAAREQVRRVNIDWYLPGVVPLRSLAA